MSTAITIYDKLYNSVWGELCIVWVELKALVAMRSQLPNELPLIMRVCSCVIVSSIMSVCLWFGCVAYHECVRVRECVVYMYMCTCNYIDLCIYSCRIPKPAQQASKHFEELCI